MAGILLIDDERIVRETLGKLLRAEGYVVHTARNGKTALALFSEKRPELVLLDVMMPSMDGYAVCEEMRRIDREVPIVFLSALGSDASQIRGLEAGADDYVPKSASKSLLLARIKKAIERADRFSRMDAPSSFTKVEADIYRVLDSERGRYFSYDELFDAVYGDGYLADECVMRVHICNMRKKLKSGEAIKAQRGKGFTLIEE